MAISIRIFCLLAFYFLATSLPAQDLYDPNHIVEIRITFDRDDWAAVLDSLKMDGEKDRLTASIEIDGQQFQQVGVRYKGNSSYFNVKKSGAVKLPFNIEANHEIKDQRFPGGYETLKLSNGFRDPSFMREALSYEIARRYMPAPRCNFARLYINDEYLGLYNNTQSIDDVFLEEHFGTDNGAFIKCDPEWSVEPKSYCPEGDKASLMYQGDNPNCYMGLYELKSKKGWTELVNLTRVLNEEPDSVHTVLNVDHALWMLAFNSVLVNLDSYTGRLCHNYYLFEAPDGRFTSLLWDMNLSLGGFRFAGTNKSLTNEDMQTMSPFLHYKTKNPKRPLIVKLLSNSLYRKIYIGHIRTLVEENFANGFYRERMAAYQELIAEAVENDPHRLYDYEGFLHNDENSVKAGRAEIIGITELMEARTEYLLAHPVLQGPVPVIDNPRHITFGPTLAVKADLQYVERAILMYRRSDDEPFQPAEMFDDGGHNDDVDGDDIWGATIDYEPGIEYYIIAEGERSASLAPAGASYQVFTVE